jgi:hypothetical protein
MPANGKTKGRFELPAYAPINYSLTDGTSIPPPPDSPIEETPPAPQPEPALPVPAKENVELKASNANGAADERGRSNVQPPLSPASSRRPSSIRKFLSRRSLNANYTNGAGAHSNEDLTGSGRPESPASFMTGPPGLKQKRSKSWFKRLGSSTRQSTVFEDEPVEKAKPAGPPPPKLPELNQLKAKVTEDDQGSLGGEDLFKNIT